ncbi:MAG: YitT family protein [Erysipelotrichaceae bacterium]|jgi:uncharacterized membrane-anchored protein YitT (DUF2179 family)|nr:YitT family protein [Bacillota bacterium]NLP21845.1 YitT family protein [Erysipelotrichaceae bacterium]
MKIFNINFTKKDIRIVILVLISSFMFSISMNNFIKTGNLYPAGYAGISRLISQILYSYFNIYISFSLIFMTLNVITTIFVFNNLGKKFAIYSIIWYTSSTFFTSVLPSSSITDDLLLISIFGGILNGIAISIALRNNASSGGTDFIAVYMSTKYNKPMFNSMMTLNVCILLIAGYLFGWDKALYSIIYQFTSTQVINSLHNRYKLTNLFIITEKSKEVADAFYATCRHGITKINVEGKHSKRSKTLLFSTINSYQLEDVINAIKKADPSVFISISQSERVIGNYYQKPLE